MVDGVAIDMRNLVTELKQVDKALASQVRKQVRAAITSSGKDIVDAVRSSASWSSRIPAATTIRPNFTARSAGVRIVTNRRKAPHARPYEFGNHGGGGSTFFNGTHGVVRTRPFFFQSIERRTPAMEQKFRDAIEQAVRDAGFH